MAGKTVLVIDADSETEQVIASTLESEGYLVFAVPGGDVGAEMAQKVKPSLIFVNPEDTSEKGMEVCRTIRSHESLKSVPIVLLTSRPGGADPGGPYGVVDSLLLPVSAAELLEKTEKAITAKAPVVLRVKEKAPAFHEDKVPAEEPPPSEEPREVGVRSRLSDLAEIAGMEETEEVPSVLQRDRGEDVESYMPEEEGSGRRSRKLLVALLAILVIVVGAAGALYFSGLIPGMGPGAKMQPPPLQTAEKAKAQESAPAGEPQKQQAEEEKTASAPAAVAPVAPVKSAAPASPSPAVTAAKPSGKTVYSVQVGAFRSESNADALAKQLKEKGYDAFSVKRSAKDGNTIYRVLVGRFDDRRESRQLASAIGKKEKIGTVIVSE